MEVKYKGAGIAPMMRAFGDRGKDGVITLEEFEDESGGGFSTVQFAHARLKKMRASSRRCALFLSRISI